MERTVLEVSRYQRRDTMSLIICSGAPIDFGRSLHDQAMETVATVARELGVVFQKRDLKVVHQLKSTTWLVCTFSLHFLFLSKFTPPFFTL